MSTESILAPADPQWIRQQIRADDEARLNHRVARVQRVKVHKINPHLMV
jgi:hypothetical protein